MFPNFTANYPRDTSRRDANADMSGIPTISGLHEFFREFGGVSFRGGIYRVIAPAELESWRRRLDTAFPAHKEAFPFAFDWLGRLFALEQGRLVDGERAVLLLEPGTGEALEIPSNLETFHEIELTVDNDAALASTFFKAWRSAGNAALNHDECAGYRVPLFLDGTDDLSNLEVSDIDVYWHIMGMLLEQI